MNAKKNEIVMALVIPCFNEEEILSSTVEKLTVFLDSLINVDKTISPKSFILLVDDGSTDQTWRLIEKYSQERSCINGISLARNVGHQNALLSGLLFVREHCDFSVSIDADLQDDFHVIKQMIARYEEGSEIVYGVRKNRDTDSVFKRSSAILFYKLMALLGTKIIYNHADFRLMGKDSLSALSQYDEVNFFLRGIVSNLGFKTSSVYYDRLERKAGISKYTFFRMLHLAWEGITSFSVRPLRFISLLGFSCFAFSFMGGIFVLYGRFIEGKVVQGWTSMILSVFLLGGVQLLSVGLIGEYIGKIYNEVKHRPKYVIEKKSLRSF